MLSFDMFVNNWAGRPLFNEGGLTTGAGANQHGRVDILTAGAGAFSTAGADVLANLYLDAPNLGNPQAYTPYSFNLSTLLAAGGTYQIRFAEADNQGYLNMGVDNVSILETAVPEPSTYLAGALLLLPFGLQGIRHFRSRKQAA